MFWWQGFIDKLDLQGQVYMDPHYDMTRLILTKINKSVHGPPWRQVRLDKVYFVKDYFLVTMVYMDPLDDNVDLAPTFKALKSGWSSKR